MTGTREKHEVLVYASTKTNHYTVSPWAGWESFPGISPAANSPGPAWATVVLHPWER